MSSAAPGRLRDFFSSRSGIAVLVVAALCLAGATAFALRGDDEPEQDAIPLVTTTTTTLPPVQTPMTGVLLGASTSPDFRSLAAEKSAAEDLEQRIGRTLDINHNFYTWDEPFPTETERWDLQAGRIPLISWNGRNVTTKTIARGSYDDMIRQRARQTKALGQPVMIRWFWEMDGRKKAEFAGEPEEYIAAWKHIVGIFRAEGADNVRWVWCPNASAFNDGDAQEFYPGDDFVDWTCADGYNWAPGRAGDDWESFKDIFGGFYSWAVLHNKPIMVGEFGVQERKPGEKAQWITEAREAIKTDFPLLRAIVYFSSNADYDWRLTTSDSALEAFRQMAHDPYFNLGVNGRSIL
jgi:Glycosyl hydrolase family 26